MDISEEFLWKESVSSHSQQYSRCRSLSCYAASDRCKSVYQDEYRVHPAYAYMYIELGYGCVRILDRTRLIRPSAVHEVCHEEELYRCSHTDDNNCSRHVFFRIYRLLGERSHRVESYEYDRHDRRTCHDRPQLKHVSIVERFRIDECSRSASAEYELDDEYHSHDQCKYRSYNIDIVHYRRDTDTDTVANCNEYYCDYYPRPYRHCRYHDVQVQSAAEIAGHRQQEVVEHEPPSCDESQLRPYRSAHVTVDRSRNRVFPAHLRIAQCGQRHRHACNYERQREMSVREDIDDPVIHQHACRTEICQSLAHKRRQLKYAFQFCSFSCFFTIHSFHNKPPFLK